MKDMKSFLMGFWVSYRYWVVWENIGYFLILTFLKPAMSFSLWVLMFLVSRVVNPSVSIDKLAFMLTGMVLFSPLMDVMFGTVEILHMEREHYNIYKLLLISRSSLFLYTLGRSTLLFLRGLLVAFMILSFVATVMELDMNMGLVFWVSLLVPAMGFLAIGIMVSSLFVVIESVLDAWTFAGVVVGPSYLICGVVFPVDVLPPSLQKVAYWLPQTYWIELPRRILIGKGSIRIDDLSLCLVAVSTSVALLLISCAVLKRSIEAGRNSGSLDTIRGA